MKYWFKKMRYAQRKVVKLEGLREKTSNVGGLDAIIFCAKARLRAIQIVILEETEKPNYPV